MGFVLMKQELKHVLNCSIQDVTSRFAGIELTEGDAALSDDICTVHTILEGNCRGALLLCADTALLTRVAQKIMGSENVTLRDIEDVATEYFNVICGRVVAGIFQTTRVSSRFQIPRFLTGRYLPEERASCQCVLNYNGGNNERMQFSYVGLHAPKESQSA